MLPYLLTVSTIRTSIFYGQIPITSSHWHPGKGGRYPQKIIPHPNTPPNKKTHVFYMGVSENSGFSPQIIHFNRVFYYFHPPFWGVSPYFWKHPLMMHLFFSANRPWPQEMLKTIQEARRWGRSTWWLKVVWGRFPDAEADWLVVTPHDNSHGTWTCMPGKGRFPNLETHHFEVEMLVFWGV